jgi:hypothetical protein
MTGRWWEQLAEELGGVDVAGGVSVVMAGGCSSSFYSGRGGARRGEGGGNGGANGLNVIDGGAA